MKLRHFQLIVLLVLTMHTTVFAQDIRIGVQAGGGVASAYSYYPERNEYVDDAMLRIPKNYIVPSYGLNLYFSISLNSEFAIAIEPGIIQKGYSNNFLSINDRIHNRYYLTYFQSPFLLEYSFENPVTLTIGPEIGYLIYGQWISSDGVDENITERRRTKFDVGLQFGTYYTYAERFDLGLKLGGSFTNLDKLYLYHYGDIYEMRRKAIYMNAFLRVKF